MENGLPKELEVVWEGGSFVQKLDYWRVSFQCHCCRGTIHSKENCFSSRQRDSNDIRSRVIEPDVTDGVNFPLLLEHSLASSFVGKFVNFVPILLKFLSVE